MTRGILILITDTNAYESSEFNGGMYFECHGEEVVRRFQSSGVKDKESFEEMITLFNAKNFHYPNNCCTARPLFVADMMDLRNDYIKNWFSDYLYIKNASNRNIHIICSDEDDAELEHILQPKEIAWFCFGHFCASVMENDDLDAKDSTYTFSQMEASGVGEKVKKVQRNIATMRTLLQDIEGTMNDIKDILTAHLEEDKEYSK